MRRARMSVKIFFKICKKSTASVINTKCFCFLSSIIINIFSPQISLLCCVQWILLLTSAFVHDSNKDFYSLSFCFRSRSLFPTSHRRRRRLCFIPPSLTILYSQFVDPILLTAALHASFVVCFYFMQRYIGRHYKKFMKCYMMIFLSESSFYFLYFL